MEKERTEKEEDRTEEKEEDRTEEKEERIAKFSCKLCGRKKRKEKSIRSHLAKYHAEVASPPEDNIVYLDVVSICDQV